MLLDGDDVPADPLAARSWTEKAVAQGIAASMTRLGRIYHEGLAGAARDPRIAVKWWEKAAEAGDPGGAFMFGGALHVGLTIEPDPDRALVMLLLARRAGSNIFADAFIRELLAKMEQPAIDRAKLIVDDMARLPPWSKALAQYA